MTIVIGLTGNIGTGKSTVLQMLAGLGAQIIDADELAHEVIAPGGPAYAAVVEAFGQEIVQPDGRIDRGKLGAIVFRDPQALTRLEAFIHPAVVARTRELITQTRAEVVVVEAIKLLEADMARQLCAAVWVVTCRPEQQLARVMAQRGLSEAEARLRMEAQPPQEEKIAQADVVIDNSGTVEETWRQVQAAWEKLREGKEGKKGTEATEGAEVRGQGMERKDGPDGKSKVQSSKSKEGNLRPPVRVKRCFVASLLSITVRILPGGTMNVLRRFWDEHPRLVMWIVLAIGMVAIMIWAAWSVGFTAAQWAWLVAVTIGLAGACSWIIGWEDR